MPALLTAAAAVAASALTLAGSALAAPALVVNTSHLVRGSGPATIITSEDAGTYRTTILAPAAYRLPNVASLGRRIGTASARVATAGGSLTFQGWITGAAPANYVLDSCASFAGESHQAVWLVQLRQTNGLARAEIPIYVDAGPAGRTELTWCASLATELTVTRVALRFDRSFFNPIVAGNYTWQARFDNAASSDRSALAAVTTSATATVPIHARKR